MTETREFSFDAGRYRLPAVPGPPSTPRRARRRSPFLKGPVSIAWLARAGRCPGKGPLQVGLALRFLTGLTGQQRVRLTGKTLARLGIVRKTAYRGLTALEEADLVRVERRRGRCPMVTVVEVDDGVMEDQRG